MKFIKVVSAFISKDKSIQGVTDLYCFSVVDIKESALEEIKTRMGFTDELKDADDAPKTLLEAIEHVSFAAMHIEDLMEAITPDMPDYPHIMYPNCRASSVSTSFLIPFTDNAVIGQWLTSTAETKQPVTKLHMKSASLEGFVKSIQDEQGEPLTEYDNYLKDGSLVLVESESTRHQSPLKVQYWDFEKNGSLCLSSLASIEYRYSTYCKYIGHDNHSISRTTAYRASLVDAVSDRNIKADDIYM